MSVMSQIVRLMDDIILEKLTECGYKGICASHGAIICVLYEKNRLRMNELALYINKDKATVTALVNKLENLDFVQRIDCPCDSRAKYVELTELGKMAISPSVQISKELLDIQYEYIDDDERRIFMGVLSKMLINLNNHKSKIRSNT